MKKLLLVLLFPALLLGAQKQVMYDSITHGVIKPPTSTSTIYDLDFTGLTIGGLAGGGGGGGTPGGANQQLQFNNSFTLGGIPYATFDGSAVTFRSGARFILADPTDATKRVQIALANPTATLKTLTISDNSVSVIPSSVTTNQFVTNINTLGVVVTAQPLFSNIGGLLSLSQTTMSTNKLLGRGTAGTGAAEEITLGTNLTLTGTTLNATGGGGGTPGGADTQFQYNNATAFGGSANLVLSGGQVKAVDANFVLKNISDATKTLNWNLAAITTATNVTAIVPPGTTAPVLVRPDVGAANNFLTGIGSTGIPTKAQPNFTDIAGTLGLAQQNFPIAHERFVDPVNGSDITGAANLAKPYLTIAAACAAASSGDVIYLYPNLTGYDQGVTALVIPAGVTIVGAGPDTTVIKSALTGVTRMAVEPSTASAIYNVTIQNTSSTGGAFGVGSASVAFTSAYVGGCKILGNKQGIYLNQTGTTGLVVENSNVATQNDTFFQNVSTAVTSFRNCEFTADGTTSVESKGLNVTNGTARFNYGNITVGGSTTTNVGAFASGAGAIIELHGVRISNSGGGATNYDLQQQSSASVGKDGVYRPDGGALVTNGTITELSRYAVIDNNLTDFPNIGAGTRGDIIYRGASGWTKLIAGIDGNVLTTHGNTADPTWATAGTGATVSDTAFAATWNGQTVTAPSQNATYDYLHLMTPNDDGKVALLNQVAGLAITNASGVLQTPRVAPGSAIVGISDAQTLTTKRITRRSASVSGPPGTPAINTDNFDVIHYTGVSTPITGLTMSGTPVEGDTLRMDFTDDGTARALTFPATDFEASPGQSLPTTTTAGTRLDVGFIWNTTTSKWRCVASTNASTGGAGAGTVTSVGASGSNGITVSGSPVTTSGTIALGLPITLAGTAGKTLTVSNSLTLAGTDGSTLNVGAGGTLGSNAFTSTAFLTSAAISDAVFATAWNGDATTAPSKNAVYDEIHSFDTNNNGKVDVLDLTTAELVKTDVTGAVNSAVGGTDYANLAFKTVSVSGQSDVVADTASDTVTFAAGSGMTITTTPGTDTVTFASSGGGGAVSDTVFGVTWDGTTATAPSKNAVYDYLHIMSPSDNGKASLLDVSSDGLLANTGGFVYTAAVNSPFNFNTGTGVLSFLTNVNLGLTLQQTITLDDATNNGVSTPLRLIHTTTGTPANGIATGLDFVGEATSGTVKMGDINFAWSNVSTKNSIITLDLVNGAVAAEAVRIFASKALGVGITTDPGAGYVDVSTGYKINGVALAASDVGAQPLDSDLTTIAGLTATTDNFIIGVSSAWASRTPAQARTTLGLVIGTNVQAWDADLDTYATKTPPSGAVVGTTDTQTLTNKRVNPRASGGCDETSSATSTPDSDNCDQWDITALAVADVFVAPSGTPVNGQNLVIRIKDAGAAKALTFPTASSGQYRFSSDMAAPTTTVISKTMYLGFKWNAADSRWDNVAQLNNF